MFTLLLTRRIIAICCRPVANIKNSTHKSLLDDLTDRTVLEHYNSQYALHIKHGAQHSTLTPNSMLILKKYCVLEMTANI